MSGARGEFLGTSERIASGRVFKKHIDEALAISPNDATLHHLLGRFCYEVSRPFDETNFGINANISNDLRLTVLYGKLN